MAASPLLRRLVARFLAPDSGVREKYRHFRALLESDAQALDLVADLDAHLYGHDPADMARIRLLTGRLTDAVRLMCERLRLMAPGRYDETVQALEVIAADAYALIRRERLDIAPPYVLNLAEAAEWPELAGGKGANLSLAGRHGVPTPPGFVVTTRAFARYLQDNGLEEDVERCFQTVSLANHDSIVRATGELQELILGAEIPADIAGEVLSAMRRFGLDGGPVAVRSSALAEDGRVSFAGQYASELDVPPEDVLAAYKRVLAGKYCPRAVAYRLRHGLTDAGTAMAVLVLPMIDASAAGVAYTRDPACASVGGEAVGVYVVDGVASDLVDGSRTPEKHFLSREVEPDLLMGCVCEDIPKIDRGVLREVGKWAMLLERAFGEPQDVEWACGPGGVTILQTRRLQQEQDREVFSRDETETAEVLARDLDCASPGAACGMVRNAASGADFRKIPPGSVVVTDSLRPALSQFLDRISAIVAESGSRASHLASVARERGVPVVVGCGPGAIEEGVMVTVDGAAGKVFAGCLSGVTERRRDTDLMRARTGAGNEAIVARTVRLNLTDANSGDFSPSGCRTLHDLIRYCHEKGVAEMFSLSDRGGLGMGRSRRLETDLPLVMYVLDLGGGISGDVGAKGPVAVSMLESVPLRALWEGLSDRRIEWDRSQLHVDWEAFDRISGGIFRADSRLLASFALVSPEYTHVNIRFGYHFSVVDALCGDAPGANYVRFRFKGGGAAANQRGHRLLFVRIVLERFGFETDTRGDMLDASLSRLPAVATVRALRVLGAVLGVTRLMDVRLAGAEDAHREAAAFLERYYPESDE